MNRSLEKKIILALSLLSLFLLSTLVGGFGLLFSTSDAGSCSSLPCSNSITITSYNGNDQAAISDLTNGKIAAYDFQLTPVEAAGIPSSFSRMAVPNGLYGVEVNPENTSWSNVSSISGWQPNPFYYPQIRQALNYVLDRSYFVDNILGGAGVPILSVYGVAPDSLTVANGTATFQSYLTYNFALANQTIHTTMMSIKGVIDFNGHYYYGGKPINVYLIDRTDDPFRSQYAGFLATQLTNLGFNVVEETMNLALVKTTVFVENPVDGTGGAPPTPWDIYIASYGNVYLYYGDFLQVCFDGANCAAGPYSDNASSGDLANGAWNTTAETPPDVIALSDKLDQLNNQILSGAYSSLAERTQILTNYTQLEIEMGVNDWIATGLNEYGFNPAQVSGLVASFRSSPILNTQSYMQMMSTSDASLNLGVRYLSQYSMNPIGGYGDSYSQDLVSGVFPGLTSTGPGTGYTWPFGWTYSVDGMNSSATIPVPSNAVNYNSSTGAWYDVTGSKANLAVTVNVANLVQHTGYSDNESYSLADLMYGYEVGMNVTNPADAIYDKAATTGLALDQSFGTILGFKFINSTAFTLYSSYYFFDPAQAALTAVGNIIPYREAETPWTIYQAMSDLVAAKDDAWASPTAATKGIPWLTLVGSGPNGSPTDISNLIKALQARSSEDYIPSSLTQLQTLSGVSFGLTNVGQAYNDAANFIKTYNNGLISYGPYFVSTWQAQTTPNYAVLTKNPNFKLGPYLAPQLFAPASQISVSTTVPAMIQEGSSISLTALSTVLGQTTATPQSNVNIVVQLVNSTAVVSQVKLVSGPGGSATYTLPSDVPPGSYSLTIYASSANSTIIVPQTYTLTLLSPITTSSTSTTSSNSGPPSTISTSTCGCTTATTIISTSSTGTPPTTVSSSSSSTSSSSGISGTNLTIAAVVVVIVIIAAVAVVVMRRR